MQVGDYIVFVTVKKRGRSVDIRKRWGNVVAVDGDQVQVRPSEGGRAVWVKADDCRKEEG